MADSTPRATDDIGVFFSDTAIHRNDKKNFAFIPQVRNQEGRILTDKSNWVLVCGTYLAYGGEKYITIGNFFNDFETTFEIVTPYSITFQSEGAYYIDMVSLYDCTGFAYSANAGGNQTVCKGNSITLGTDDDPNRKYSWSPATGLSDSTKARPQASSIETTTYVLSVIDEFIQQTYDTITLTVDTTCGTFPVYVANIFSPNGDGVNDILYVRSTFVKELDFKVYNRWGNLLFETSDISTGWDGRCKSRDCPDGVYFYLAEVTFSSGESVVKKGNVTIVR